MERAGGLRHRATWSTFGFLSWPLGLRYCWLGCRMPTRLVDRSYSAETFYSSIASSTTARQVT